MRPQTLAGEFRRGPLWRARQFAQALTDRHDPATDAELRRLLDSDAQWRLLARLSAFDRAHHLRVHRLLWERGERDPDLLRAALLHDVGKADARGAANALDRAAVVLLRRLAPARLARVTRGRDRLTRGVRLVALHAERGAELAREAGASARCCELIARHETPVGDDAALAALIAADDAAIR